METQSNSTVVSFGDDVLERMERAVRRVAERLERSTSALESASVDYALGGSNATAIWISTVDESAVRQARNVELVLRPKDVATATQSLEAVGFLLASSKERVCFQDGPTGKPRDGIELIFGGEPVVGKSPELLAPNPNECEAIEGKSVLRLASLVEFQLARYRLDDAVDLRDMLDVDLIDATWLAKFPRELADRLQHLLDTPDG